MGIKIIKQLTNPNLRFCALDTSEDIKQGKSPGIKTGWQKGLTLKELEKEMISNPRASEIRFGIIGGPGNLRVIDVDKKGKWFESIVGLIEAEFPQTLTIKTISGGKHYYYYSETLPNIDFKDESGEIRAENRMVVAPNSMLDGKKYEIMKDKPIANLKPFLIKKFLDDYLSKKEVNEKTENLKITRNVQEVLNIEKDIKLQTLLEGDYSKWGTRSEAEASLCQKLVFYGLTKDQVFEVMENHSKIGKWKEAPDGYKQLTYEKALGWQPASEAPIQTNTGEILKLKTVTDIFNLKPNKQYIVDQLIYPENIIMLVSPPKNYKSLFSLYLAMCIANGRPFFGLKTKKNSVLYLDKENSDSLIHQRLHAIKRGHPKEFPKKRFPLNFLIRQGDINNPKWVQKLNNTVKKHKIGLIIFDTLHRFGDYDENSANDINKLYNNVFKPLISDQKCSILFLHHTKKDGGYRGSGDLLGFVDSAYQVRKFNGDEFKIECIAARGGEIDDIVGVVDVEQDAHKQLHSVTFIQKSKEDLVGKASEQWTKKKQACDLIMGYFLSKGLDSYRKKVIEYAILLDKKDELSKETIKSAFKYLVFKRILRSDGRGLYTKIDNWFSASD